MRLAAAALTLLIAASPAAAQETPYQAVPRPEPGRGVCPGGLCQPQALSPLFEALEWLETGEGAGWVHILQLGDSHTAGDAITGKVRAVLQGRFGAAGRGVLPPGVPYPGYGPHQIEVKASDWRTTLAPLTGPNDLGVLGVGLTGVKTQTFGTAPELTLTLDPGPDPYVLVELCGAGGQVAWSSETEAKTFNLDQDPDQPLECDGVITRHRPTTFRLRPSADARLHSLTVRDAGSRGLVLSNLGVVGASLRDLAARDDQITDGELTRAKPSLVILAFGTNEGFDDRLDLVGYEQTLRAQIARLRRYTRAILIMGAPDALRNGVTTGCSSDGKRNPPPMLAAVRDLQRRVAAEEGVAYWDWHGRMGGDCAADRLALWPEPYMRGDRVHFTSAGADWIGGVLADDLMAAYAAWKAGRG